MKSEERKKDFLSLFDKFYTRAKWEVFSDFVVMSACALSNPLDKQHYDEREKLYLSIAGKYTKDEINIFPNMLAHLIEIFSIYDSENQVRDVLGWLFEKLELHNKYRGQFFTPEHICELMSRISFDKGDKAIEERGFLTLNEPCSGSGRMILAFANVMRDKGYNHQKNLFVVAQDIDLNCVCMTYIQLALYGIPAIVIHGNALTCKAESHWYTPAYFYDMWYAKEIFPSNMSEDMRSRKISADAQVSFEDLFD